MIDPAKDDKLRLLPGSFCTNPYVVETIVPPDPPQEVRPCAAPVLSSIRDFIVFLGTSLKRFKVFITEMSLNDPSTSLWKGVDNKNRLHVDCHINRSTRFNF
ncbi:hypothetical protein GO730_38530 [Spirosoma sp. HMF3257]|uniref:hypothetical protein n=1 Tax=Spirosoma telluris TaxID=2183553 RepID=UPI0011B946E0|nr:hypothetical protein [Spirosoma telluris]